METATKQPLASTTDPTDPEQCSGGEYLASLAAKVRAALKLKPDDPESYAAYSALAQALVQAKRSHEALRRCREAVAIGKRAQSKNRRIVLRTWGYALNEQKDYEGAAAKFREALELEPDDRESYAAYNVLALVFRP